MPGPSPNASRASTATAATNATTAAVRSRAGVVVGQQIGREFRQHAKRDEREPKTEQRAEASDHGPIPRSDARSCQPRLARRAPSAPRARARRTCARASMRFARFAHAISTTIADAANITESAGLTVLVSRSCSGMSFAASPSCSFGKSWPLPRRDHAEHLARLVERHTRPKPCDHVENKPLNDRSSRSRAVRGAMRRPSDT